MSICYRYPQRGSIIAFTLIVLSFLLTAGLAVITVAVVEKKSGLATQKSVVAFQAADSGAERVLERIYAHDSPSLTAVPLNGTIPGDTTLTQVARNLLEVAAGASCNSSTNKITATSNSSPPYSFEVAFYDGNDALIACNDTAWRDKAVNLKSDGFFRQTSRVIETGINPRPRCTTGESVTDGNGNSYGVILIGEQCWTNQNMRAGNFTNGSTAQTNNSVTERYCYNNSAANCTANHPNRPDGGLYTWDEAMGYTDIELSQGVCPNGWHIPSDNDWYILEHYLDAGITDPNATGWRGTVAGDKLKPGPPGGSASGTTQLNLNLGGYFNTGTFQQRDNQGNYWTSTKQSNGSAYYRSVNSSQNGVNRFNFDTRAAFSVRCIKN